MFSSGVWENEAGPVGAPQRSLLKRVVGVPRTTPADIESVFETLGTRFPV